MQVSRDPYSHTELLAACNSALDRLDYVHGTSQVASLPSNVTSCLLLLHRQLLRCCQYTSAKAAGDVLITATNGSNASTRCRHVHGITLL